MTEPAELSDAEKLVLAHKADLPTNANERNARLKWLAKKHLLNESDVMRAAHKHAPLPPPRGVPLSVAEFRRRLEQTRFGGGADEPAPKARDVGELKPEEILGTRPKDEEGS